MRLQKGFTLLELMITVAIIGIIASIAVPSFSKMLERNRLKTVVQSFQDDMQFARIQAIKQNQDIRINRVQTSATAGDWCYGITAKTASCNCTTVGDCEIKTISGENFNTANMYSASGNSTFGFRRGTIGANGVTFTTSNYASRVVFSDAGRVRICTPPNANGGATANDRPVGTVGLVGKPDC